MSRSSGTEIHVLAAFVHGVLASMHVLGAIYNMRRRNRWQTCAHVAGVVFSAHSTIHHIKEAK